MDLAPIRTALTVALRYLEHADTSPREAEAILLALVELGGADGEVAARILFHRREVAALQLQLQIQLTSPEK